jgi:hypothetical protein
VDPEQQAHDVSFIMATASRFICEPWRWVGHLYLPFLTAVSEEGDWCCACCLLTSRVCKTCVDLEELMFFCLSLPAVALDWPPVPAFFVCGENHCDVLQRNGGVRRAITCVALASALVSALQQVKARDA